MEEGSCKISIDVCVSVCFLRRGHRPCGRHAVGCWTRWWARARCGLSSRGSEQGRGPSASPPVLGTPPTPPPAQGAPDSCARPADWPSPSSDARWARAVAGHDECGAKNWPPAHLHGWTRDKKRGWSEYGHRKYIVIYIKRPRCYVKDPKCKTRRQTGRKIKSKILRDWHKETESKNTSHQEINKPKIQTHCTYLLVLHVLAPRTEMFFTAGYMADEQLPALTSCQRCIKSDLAETGDSTE